jgi:carboxymethylenebutenolidase
MSSTVTVTSAGSEMKLYTAQPAGAAKGAVIVIQEAFGMTDHIKDICNRIAAAGYLAVAPHVFHRTGDPLISYENMRDVMPHLMALNRADIEADLKACFDYLAGQGFKGRQVGIIGFCMGGTISFFAGAEYELGAAVTYYGGGIAQGRFGLPGLAEMAPGLKTPWQGNFGDLDQQIPVAEVEQLREAAEKAGVTTEINRYAEADHGFHCNDHSAYHEASAQDSWPRTIAFFDAHIKAG